MFWYSYQKRGELAGQRTTDTTVLPTTTDDADPIRINAVHFFKDNAHTVVGELMMPTPCDLITSEVVVAESKPEQVRIALTKVNNAATCAQVLTPERFRVDFSASKEAVVTATLDGKEVILNLRDAEPGATPEKLEDLYFKG
jgi:hypothetical protein